MKPLLINGLTIHRSSQGVRRYYEAVKSRLDWHADTSAMAAGRHAIVDRLREMFAIGSPSQLIWSPSHRGPLFARNHIVTVHDCINIRYVYTKGIKHALVRTLSQRMFDNAAAIVAISDTTAAVLCESYRISPERLHVIRSSNELLSRLQPRDADLDALGGAPRYVLMVTNAYAHKNALRACEAIARVRATGVEVELRIVGSLEDGAAELCKKLHLPATFETKVDDGRLASLYRKAAAVLCPSIEEGHNLVIAEALANKATVIASDIPVHREFYPREVIFVDPLDVDSMAVAIGASLDGKAQASESLIVTRTWQDVANDYRDLFSAL